MSGVAVSEETRGTRQNNLSRLTISSMGVGQIVSWGSLIYAFPLLAEPMIKELGLERAEAFFLPSLSLTVSALAAYPVGILVDRGHGRSIMVAGSVLACLVLLWWSAVETTSQLHAVFTVLGIAQAMTLYDVAFAIVARLKCGRARGEITTLTLWGALASTVTLPLLHLGLELCDWRSALLLLAIGNLTVAAITGATVPSVPGGYAIERSKPDSQSDQHRPSEAVKRPVAWLLAMCFASYAGMAAVLVIHLYALLLEMGLGVGAAVAAMALLGPAQIFARLLVARIGDRLAVPDLGSFAILLPVLAIASLSTSQISPWFAFASAILFGMGNGMMTIIRGLAVPEMISRKNYGAINSIISAPSILTKAAAPFLAALLWQAQGSYDVLLAVLTALAILAAVLFWLAAFVFKRDHQQPS